MPMFKLRNYQDEASDAVIQDWQDGIQNVLVALPTGTGKTEVGLYILKKIMKPGQRALWIAHRDELLQQAEGRFKRRWPEAVVGIVKAHRNEVDTGVLFGAPSIIVGSIQTLCRPKRLKQLLDVGPIDYLVYDEAHHAVTASGIAMIKGLFEINPNMCHVGLTATPYRMDDKALAAAYGKISYQMNIQKAISDGWLCPIDGQQIETGVELGNVQTSKGDYVAKQLEDVLDAAGWVDMVADGVVKFAPDMHHICYTAGVSSAERLAEALNERGITAAHINANTPTQERRDLLDKFRRKEIQAITNVGILTEGFDAPSADCVVMARPTKSNSLFTQMLGRVLRIEPGKERALALLFCTTEATILDITDLGKSKELKEAEEAAAEVAVEGVSGALPLFDVNTINGVGLYAKVVGLFSSSSAAWYNDGATFSVGLGMTDGFERTLVIVHLHDEWVLYGVGRGCKTKRNEDGVKNKQLGPWKSAVITSSDSFEDVMDRATELVDQYGLPILSTKNSSWRRDPASVGQLRMLGKWIHAFPGITKGDAARLISHHIALDVLKKDGARL